MGGPLFDRMGGEGSASWYNCSRLAEDLGGRIIDDDDDGSAIRSEDPPDLVTDEDDGEVELEVRRLAPSSSASTRLRASTCCARRCPPRPLPRSLSAWCSSFCRSASLSREY